MAKIRLAVPMAERGMDNAWLTPDTLCLYTSGVDFRVWFLCSPSSRTYAQEGLRVQHGDLEQESGLYLK